MTTFAEQKNEIKASYRAGTTGPLRPRVPGVASGGSHANYHFSPPHSYWSMIERSRYYDREDSIVGQGVTRLIDNLVQGGFALDLQWDNPKLEQRALEDWYPWTIDADRCHSEGRLTFHEMEKLVIRHVFFDGDHWPIPRRDGSLQLVESHRVRSSNWAKNSVLGVETDDDGRRTKVWICKEDQGLYATLKQTDLQEFGPRDVWQVVLPKRVSQQRGVPITAPVSDMIGMHDDLEFAQLVKAQMQSAIALLSKFEKGSPNLPPPGSSSGATAAETTTARGVYDELQGVFPGMHYRAQNGETVEAFAARVPNPEFFEHMMLVLSIIAVNLHLPIHVLLLDAKHTNFSGQRAAIEQARITWRELQSWYASQFHRRVFNWRLKRMLAMDQQFREDMLAAELVVPVRQNGRIVDWTGRAFGDCNQRGQLGHCWQPPRWPYVEPVKDITARMLELAHTLTSPRRSAARVGDDWSTIVDETVTDRAAAVRRAMTESEALAEEFPNQQPVPWAFLCPLPTPAQFKVAINLDGESDAPEPSSPGEPPEPGGGNTDPPGGEN